MNRDHIHTAVFDIEINESPVQVSMTRYYDENEVPMLEFRAVLPNGIDYKASFGYPVVEDGEVFNRFCRKQEATRDSKFLEFLDNGPPAETLQSVEMCSNPDLVVKGDQ